MTPDPRAALEYRVPAAELHVGDLVNTNPGDDDWQQVVGVFLKPADAKSTELQTLAATVDGRYVIVQLTDLAPVDSGVYFDDGTAMIYGAGEDDDDAVTDVVSSEDGVRTYLYTKFELVTVRAATT
jgi:hypothetical protein